MWFDMKKSTLDWTSRAHSSFHYEAVLDATPEVVFDILADVDQWALWFDEFEGAEWVSEEHGGVGSRRAIYMDILDAHEEFLAWEPGKRFAFCLTKATLPLAERLVEDYQMAPLPGGRCQFTWKVYYEPKWFLKPLNPVVRLQFGKMFADAVDSLSKYVRSRSAAA
jgi:hypothetical protein